MPIPEFKQCALCKRLFNIKDLDEGYCKKCGDYIDKKFEEVKNKHIRFLKSTYP